MSEHDGSLNSFGTDSGCTKSLITVGAPLKKSSAAPLGASLAHTTTPLLIADNTAVFQTVQTTH